VCAGSGNIQSNILLLGSFAAQKSLATVEEMASRNKRARLSRRVVAKPFVARKAIVEVRLDALENRELIFAVEPQRIPHDLLGPS
jgi:hypothetical protein